MDVLDHVVGGVVVTTAVRRLLFSVKSEHVRECSELVEMWSCDERERLGQR